MSATKTVRVLPAAVYDTLELAAEAFGGIAAGMPYAWLGPDIPTPRCAWALAEWSGIVPRFTGQMYEPSPLLPFQGADLFDGDDGYPSSDAAVRRINARNGVADLNARVPFAEWAEELGIVRGDS